MDEQNKWLWFFVFWQCGLFKFETFHNENLIYDFECNDIEPRNTKSIVQFVHNKGKLLIFEKVKYNIRRNMRMKSDLWTISLCFCAEKRMNKNRSLIQFRYCDYFQFESKLNSIEVNEIRRKTNRIKYELQIGIELRTRIDFQFTFCSILLSIGFRLDITSLFSSFCFFFEWFL